MESLEYIALAVGIGGLVFSAVGTAVASVFFARRKSLVSPGNGISVLKPLKGVDRETHANLESFFWLAYPRFELLFCVADSQDPAVALVRALMRQYPEVSARLLVGEADAGPNPKVNNLLIVYAAARHDTLLISDSNIRVEANYLHEMASQFRGHHMISSVVSGREAHNFAGGIEAVFLGAFYARPMILSLYARRPCMMGKSMMFSREAMEKLGGLVALAPYLAEDFVAGEMFRRAGFSVSLSHYPVAQIVGRPTWRAFWSRHLRWGRIRKTHAPLAFLLEPFFTNALLSAALSSLALSRLAALPVAPLFAAQAALWMVLDCASVLAGGGALLLLTPVHWLARELLHLPLWAHIAAGNTIQWKGGGWRLGGDGRLTGIDGEPKADSGGSEDRGIAAAPKPRPTPRPGPSPRL